MVVFVKEIVENVPKRRCLDNSEKDEVVHMLSLHANKWLIQQHILKTTGTAGIYFLLCTAVHLAVKYSVVMCDDARNWY